MSEEILVIHEYLDIFIEESKEHIHLLNELIIALENCPNDLNVIDDMFRSVHTLKGMAQSMGYQELSSLTHQIESVFASVRNGQRQLSREEIAVISDAIDSLGELIYNIVSDRDNKAHALGLVKELKRLEQEDQPFSESRKEADSYFSTQTNDQQVTHPKKTVRIDTAYFNEWLSLYCKLQNSCTEVKRISSEIGHLDLSKNIDKIDEIKDRLQELTEKMRWVPITDIFRRFRPMVQKIAKDLNKKVRLKIPEIDVKIDRAIIDDIVDLLIHFIRNAVDHGIETPDVRIKNGKKELGILTLNAYKDEDYLFIEVSDDGAGIDRNKIIDQATVRHRITADEVAQLTNSDVYQLMKEAGFSTASQLSAISGRGIGLDVANNTIESLGGKLSIDSSKDSGTTFLIMLPFDQ